MNPIILAKQEALNLIESLVRENPGLLLNESPEIRTSELVNAIMLSLAFSKNLKMYLNTRVVK